MASHPSPSLDSPLRRLPQLPWLVAPSAPSPPTLASPLLASLGVGGGEQRVLEGVIRLPLLHVVVARGACRPWRTCARRRPTWPGGRGTAPPSWPGAAGLPLAPGRTWVDDVALCSEGSMLAELSIRDNAAAAGGWPVPMTLALSNDADETSAARESDESRSARSARMRAALSRACRASHECAVHVTRGRLHSACRIAQLTG